jgi:4-hydroxybenzoate polyprenyltransferase
MLYNTTTPSGLLLVQSFAVLFTSFNVPAVPILYSYFPIFKRFTYTTVVYAISRAVIYAITSFGMIYLTKYFGHFGILVIIIPVFIGCVFGIKHFEKLEREVGNYPEKGADFSKMQFV